MVWIELWDEDIRLVSKKNRKECDVKDIVMTFISDADEVIVRYLWGCTGYYYQIWNSERHINIRFVSQRQMDKFIEFMTEIATTGELIKKYVR